MPRPEPLSPQDQSRFIEPRGKTRLLCVLAAVGAWAAAAYWGLLTLVLLRMSATKGTSPLQLVLPLVLVCFYSVMGLRVYRNDFRATGRLVQLHALGAIVAVLQMLTASPIVIVLNVIKVAIHAFGGTSAFLAQRSIQDQA